MKISEQTNPFQCKNNLKGLSTALVFLLSCVLSSTVFANNENTQEQVKLLPKNNNDTNNLTNAIETLSIYHRGRIASVNDVFTSDNTLIFPEESTSLNRTVADVLTQAVGVELNGQGGLLQSYNMRGFSRDRIKTEVNGIPIITDRRAGNSISFIPTELINSVYIQKGPSSALYGSGAMGGVVSLSTFGNSNSVGVKIQPNSDINALNTQQLHGQFTHEFINVGAVYRKAENDYSADGTLLNSRFEQSTVTAGTDFTWREIDINASVIYSKGVNIGKRSNTFQQSRNSDYPQDDHLLSQIQFSKGDVWKLQLFQHKQEWQTNIERLSDQAISRRNVTDYTSHTLGALATYALDQTLFGVEFNTRQNIKIVEQEFNANNQFLWSNTSVDANEKNIGLYVNQQWLFDQVVINAGARYDRLSVKQKQSNTISKSAFSASLNTQYRVNDSTKIIAEVASSFRFPTVSELLFSGETPRGNTQGNTALLSEKSMGYQLSLTHQFSPTIEGRVNTYLYDIENYIERVTLANTNPEIRSYLNADNATIKGVELLATWQASAQFNSSIGLQWQQGKNDQNKIVDDGLPAAIKWLWQWSFAKGSPEISALTALSGLSITNNITYRFQRSRFGPSETELPKALIWNTAARLMLDKSTEVTLSVSNVMNENYKASSDEDAAFQPKRALNIDLTWHY